MKTAQHRGGITALVIVVTALWIAMPAQASYTLMIQSRQGGGLQTKPGYTYERCHDAAESMDQTAVKAWCVPDPNEPTAAEERRAAAAAEHQATAEREAVIDPSELSVKMTIGGTIMGGAPGVPYTTSKYPMFSAVITNHSNKTLRTIWFKIRCSDCQSIPDEWTARPSSILSIPPGGQATVDDIGKQRWRWVNNGRRYTWEIAGASACERSAWDGTFKCP